MSKNRCWHFLGHRRPKSLRKLKELKKNMQKQLLCRHLLKNIAKYVKWYNFYFNVARLKFSEVKSVSTVVFFIQIFSFCFLIPLEQLWSIFFRPMLKNWPSKSVCLCKNFSEILFDLFLFCNTFFKKCPKHAVLRFLFYYKSQRYIFTVFSNFLILLDYFWPILFV